MMAGKLEGKAAIVTGAGQGAGEGCAMAMAREGTAVTLNGLTASKLERVAGQIKAFGGKAEIVAGDVTQAATIKACIDRTVTAFGRVDILVCAAQSPQMRSIKALETTDAALDELWRSGGAATLALMRAVHPHMKAAGGGSIINFSSNTVLKPGAYAGYAGTKAAIEAMSRACGAEWGPDNIRVNVIRPTVSSPAMDLSFGGDKQAQAAHAKRIPLGRVGRPEEDIGRVVAFLAGDDAAYVTCNVLSLDGGNASA
jgi:NAD(P)-dependent dehydrogenase (short-subunit alcohol dehydrogenase family)